MDASESPELAAPGDDSAASEKPRRKWRRIWVTIVVALLAIAGMALIGFVIWARNTPPPMQEALAALESDSFVTVQQTPWYSFTPTQNAKECGFIFYPGGRVDPRSYAPAARAFAEAGYTAVIPPMPLNLAILAPNRAQDVLATYSQEMRWAIGGHSLGGAMAANYVFNHSTPIQTLILWAAFPANGDSLANRLDLIATSIYGTLDGLATPDDIEASKALLPPQTWFVPIEGGNHAQFGWYGEQQSDHPATVSREEQQKQAVAATLETLDAMCER